MILEIRIQKLEIWMNSFCIFVKKNFMGIPELKEIIKLKLENADERVRIATAGFERYWRDYEWETNLLKFLRWCDSVRIAEKVEGN